MDLLTQPGIAIYMALTVVLVAWLGVLVYAAQLHKQIRDLRRSLEQIEPRSDVSAEPQESIISESSTTVVKHSDPDE